MVERFEERPSSGASRHRLPRAGEGETLDVITIGRSSVDLYGAQVGGRLEDMASFSKAVGGCPTNIAIGTARLGLKSGLITRVGDEHMGRFIREQLRARGRRRLGRAHGPGPIDVSGRARDSRRQDVPAHLLSRQLRRQRARRKRHRRSFRGARQGDRRHRNAFRAPRQRRGAETRHSLCEEARPQGRFRHRLSPQPLGPGRPWRGRGALHQIGPGLRASAADPARLRPHRRHGGGDHDRRRRRRAAGGAEERCAHGAPRPSS